MHLVGVYIIYVNVARYRKYHSLLIFLFTIASERKDEYNEPIVALFHRFGPPTDTASDVAARNIPWAATHPAWIFSLREDRDPLTVHLLSLFRVMKSEELKKRSFMGDIAFSVERLPAGKDIISNAFIPTLLSGSSFYDYFSSDLVHVKTAISNISFLLSRLVTFLLPSFPSLSWSLKVYFYALLVLLTVHIFTRISLSLNTFWLLM